MNRSAGGPAQRHGGQTVQSMADMAMSTKVKTTKRAKLPPGIVPAGDAPGLFRVRHADGSMSEAVTLAQRDVSTPLH
jgi:hypothetical protein